MCVCVYKARLRGFKNISRDMASWSAKNATKAYLRTLKMGIKTEKEPDVAEFISAMAAGNNAQLMVVACAASATSTTLALVAAAHQTGGRVICILHGLEELNSSKEALGQNACNVEFAIGEAQNLLLHAYTEADFVVIDCNLEGHEEIIKGIQERGKSGIVLGYNAFCKGSWKWTNAQLLPIGDGLLVSRIGARGNIGKRSGWVVRVDKCTGEEHVFRVRSPRGKAVGV